LAYAAGNGLLVISTPYRYAQELLARGRGFIVPFEDSAAITNTVNHLIEDPELRKTTKAKLQPYAQAMQWPNVGKLYLELIEKYF
jgi:polysaccharide biosynthesis protein PslF